jgi:hypothetical protein
MKPCPHCRLLPGERGVARLGNGRAIVSWACEACQAGVDGAMASWAVLKAIELGEVNPGVLLGGRR